MVRVQESRLHIQGLGPKGDGIFSGRKGPVYVDRAMPGDEVRARFFRDDMGVTRAEVLEILRPSLERQKAPCPHYDQCGSCTLQHLKTDYYQRWKTDLVKEAFSKVGLRPLQWAEPAFLGGYNRRRITFSAIKLREGIKSGYFRRRSDEITTIKTCLIADPVLFELKSTIETHLPALLSNGEATDFFLQRVGPSVELVITGPVGKKGVPDASVRETLTKLMKSTPIVRISWGAQDRENVEILLNRKPLVAELGPLDVHLPPGAFLQPTEEGEQTLICAVLNALPLRGRFADLFSGCGTFAGPMLSRGSVDAFESNPRAVSALSKAASRQELRAFRRDLFRNPLRRDELNRFDAVVFDPPRAGCETQAFHLSKAKCRTLIGISCNPATFARDARIICDGGYKLKSLQIVDQFLYSHHVEVVGVFSR